MTATNKSNYGEVHPRVGRKPQEDYSIREQFKLAFDSYITEEKWFKFIKESWDSNNWQKKKFLIEQRIGRSVQVSKINITKPVTVDEIMAKFENPDTFGRK